MKRWKAKEIRNKAGFVFRSGYIKEADAPAIQDRLLTAAEVDRKIAEEKGKEDE